MSSPKPSRGARCVFWLAAILTTTVAAQPSDVLFVNAVAPGGGNGRSWASAFRDLQSALTAAREDGGFREIWIARGTYIPGPTANPMRSFDLVEGVTLIGGFAGYERSPMERPPTDALTVLSGDVRGNDDSGWSDRLNDNFARVVYVPGVNAGLRNLTITGGFGAWGAGVTVDGGRLCMVECQVVRNFGRVGSNPVERVGGAGLAVYSAGTLEMTRCLIADNIAGDASTGIGTGANGGDGGGIVCEDGTLVMHACIIAGNRAGNAGTVTCGAGFPHPGMLAGDGGGVAVRRGAALLTNCIFTRNAAGAAYEGRCCTIGCGGERPGGLGAAVFAEHSSPISLLHCTIAWNTVNQDVPDAAIWADVSSPVMIENSIVWGHSGGQPTAQLAAPQDQVVSHSCVQGWTPALGGTDVIAADPRLEWTRGADGAAGTADDTLVPGSHSPCIDRALPVPGMHTDGAGLSLPVRSGAAGAAADEPFQWCGAHDQGVDGERQQRRAGEHDGELDEGFGRAAVHPGDGDIGKPVLRPIDDGQMHEVHGVGRIGQISNPGSLTAARGHEQPEEAQDHAPGEERLNGRREREARPVARYLRVGDRGDRRRGPEQTGEEDHHGERKQHHPGASHRGGDAPALHTPPDQKEQPVVQHDAPLRRPAPRRVDDPGVHRQGEERGGDGQEEQREARIGPRAQRGRNTGQCEPRCAAGDDRGGARQGAEDAEIHEEPEVRGREQQRGGRCGYAVRFQKRPVGEWHDDRRPEEQRQDNAYESAAGKVGGRSSREEQRGKEARDEEEELHPERMDVEDPEVEELAPGGVHAGREGVVLPHEAQRGVEHHAQEHGQGAKGIDRVEALRGVRGGGFWVREHGDYK